MMKKCSKCGEEKDETEFHLKRDSADGYKTICKSCCKILNSEYYANNKEAKAEYNREYYQKRKRRERWPRRHCRGRGAGDRRGPLHSQPVAAVAGPGGRHQRSGG